jgi:hypothetical protein
MTRRLLLIALLAACSKSKDKPADDKPAVDPPKAVAPKVDEKPAATPPALPKAKNLFACKATDQAAQMAKAPPSKDPWALPFTVAGCPQVPPVFAKATFGMDEATAHTSIPGSKVEDHMGYLYLGHHPHRQQFTFTFHENGKLEQFGWNVDEKQFDAMKAAWGEPISYTSLIDKELAWFNPTAKIKAIARPDKISRGLADEVAGYHVKVMPYTPFVELIGKDGVFARPILGKTPKELATAFPDEIEIKSKEENHADMAKVGVDKDTMKKVDSLGAMGDTVALKLLPTETEPNHTLVQIDLKDGKVESYTMLIPFSKDPTLRDELLADIVATLGQPTGAKQEFDKWTYTFAAPQGQIVDVSPAILDDQWQLRVHAK